MEAASSSIDARFSHQISALLNPPPHAQVQKYFEELLVQRQCHGLKIKLDGEHGKGVYSKVGFKEDDLILRDQMLVGSQHSSNKIDCFVCSFCFRFISSVELQIGRRLHLQELGVSAVDECKKSDELGCASSTSQERTSVPSDFVQSLLSGDLKLPHSDKFPLPSVVSCVGGCKEVFYCSEACAKNDWESFHSLLCTGKGSLSLNKEAVSKFTQHANETNDIFIPAAKVISSTILRYRKLKAAHAKSPGKYTPDQGDNCDFSLLLEAWKPVSVGYKRRWWDCIALPEDVDSCDEAAFRMQIKDLAHESLQLLKEALYDDECAPLFSLDIYGHIIGMFELNNLDLVVASPVEDYFLYIDDLQPLEKEKAEKVTKHLLDALGEDYSIHCQGTAFFPIQSCMNHSCIPNAKAFKRDEDRDGQATIIALRPIVEGEEITISYIDEDLAYKERQESLADYGFRCKCPKCLKEGGA